MWDMLRNKCWNWSFLPSPPKMLDRSLKEFWEKWNMPAVNFLSSDKTNGENNEPNLDHLLSSVRSAKHLFKIIWQLQTFWADFFLSLQFQSLQIYLFHKDKEAERAWNAKFPQDSWQQQQWPGILPAFGKKLARPLLQKAAFKPFALSPHPSKN